MIPFPFAIIHLRKKALSKRIECRMDSKLIEVEVKGVMPTSNGCAVFLGTDEKTFVIYVEPYIGNAISMAINGVKKDRPLTHDLLCNVLNGLEAEILSIIINNVNEGTFFARIILKSENEVHKKVVELDARPSDSMVLALQMKKPIYVSKSVWDTVEDMTEILEKITKQNMDS